MGKSLTQQLALPSLNIVYVPVTVTDRFEAIKQGKADLLCEATTATLSRREMVDFSLATFVDGASLLIRIDGPQSLQAMAGHRDWLVPRLMDPAARSACWATQPPRRPCAIR